VVSFWASLSLSCSGEYRRGGGDDVLEAESGLDLGSRHHATRWNLNKLLIEAKLAGAQRVSQTGSFVWNISTGERFGSKEFFRILGYDQPRSVTFEMVLQRAHPEDRAFVEQTIDGATREGKDLDPNIDC
jgi:hypothetical protein